MRTNVRKVRENLFYNSNGVLAVAAATIVRVNSFLVFKPWALMLITHLDFL